jgi:hypothetical protein
MPRLKQVFRNASETSLILLLELSTARYRLAPEEELTLFYDDTDEGDGPNAPLRIEYMLDGAEPMIVIYTLEDTMFLPDGSEAETDYTLPRM